MNSVSSVVCLYAIVGTFHKNTVDTGFGFVIYNFYITISLVFLFPCSRLGVLFFFLNTCDWYLVQR